MNYRRKSGRPATLALELSSMAVRLLGKGRSGGWEVLGAAPIDAGFAERIDALRVEALARGRGPVPVDLWLPPEQIMVRDLPQDEIGCAEALRRLSAESGHRAHELRVAVSPMQPDGSFRALAVPARTVAEAREYAERWGFVPGRVTTRPDAVPFGPAGPVFERPPRFPCARRAARLTASAMVAAVLIGVAAWSGLQMRPGAGPVFRPGAAPVLTLAAVDAVAPGLQRPPLSRVRHDGVQALHSIRPQAAGPALVGRVALPAVALPPALAQPSPGVTMRVGPAPALPGQVRPAPPRRSIAAAERLDPVAPTRPDRPRNEGSRQPAASHPQPLPISAVTALIAMPIEHAVLRDGPAAPEAVVRFAQATMAPRSVPDAPPPRPETASAAELGTEATDSGSAPSAVPAIPAPPPRPESAPATESEVDPTGADQAVAAPASLLAVTAAPRPLARPEEKAGRVAPAEAHRTVGADPSPAAVGGGAGRTGLDLDSTSLIGVLEATSGRQALLRTPAGQFLKVARGDSVDGWRVTAINREAVRLTRGGQNRTLLLVVR